MHAIDPQWEPHVVLGYGPPAHCYDRWRDWQQGDPRRQVFVLDTTALPIEQTLEALAGWIEEVRSSCCPPSPAAEWTTG